MLFSSPAFFLFFAVYFAFYLIVPRQYRIYLVIVGSTVFYAWWKIEYVWLPYLLMAIAYGGVHWITKSSEPSSRRFHLAVTIVTLFLPLVIFKYTNFIYSSVIGPLFGAHGDILNTSIPLGVSFVTFTLTAYVVDVYRGTFPPGQNASTVLGYVLFFPHLIAGPILRPADLMPQLDHPRERKSILPKAAIAIFTLGLVKKLVFADQIAGYVDAAYASANPSGPAALLAIYGFSAQIYCDFSGYTDMAIGIAMLLGVRLPNNFYRPYTALSLIEFWRRWHVTLSFWFRDYLYVPLGGNRIGLLRETRNILATMALAGLWHGANWTFAIWGILHGLGVSVQHVFKRTGGSAGFLPDFLSVIFDISFRDLCLGFLSCSEFWRRWDYFARRVFGWRVEFGTIFCR